MHNKFSLIICTFQRANSLFELLKSIKLQTHLPAEIIIVDGSINDETQILIKKLKDDFFIKYIRVSELNRGLTKQRNIGLLNVCSSSQIISFLDDDLILDPTFFEKLIGGIQGDIIGSDGLITNECNWIKVTDNDNIKKKKSVIFYENYYLKLQLRDFIRRILGLYPTNIQPGKIPKYGHGKSSLPPTGKIYEVDHIMGGITAYRKEVFTQIKFSTFFEGYGLYEDFDFSVRASQFGKIVTNTSALCEHHHASQGRPSKFKYGKMVVWNGYYVWRLKYPKLKYTYVFKWHIITIFLILALFGGVIRSENRRDYILEIFGRLHSYLKLFFIKPPLNN